MWKELLLLQLGIAFCQKFFVLDDGPVWVPLPMGPLSSQAFTAKSTILPFSETAVISASAHTFMPMGVGASWEMSRWVPTLPWPSSRKLCRQVMAAFSIRADI